MFESVLVANRGEIAVRVMATLRAMGIRSVAVYSDEDEGARHVREADVAVRLGPTPAHESYLHIERVLEAVAVTRAQAVHPGYGFLSENPTFVRACEAAGVVFIGPSVDAVEMMGDKVRAKAAVAAAGVAVVPGRAHADMDDRDLVDAAAQIGFPVIVKPSAGGGGKGMRLVRAPDELAGAIASARREAAASFGDDSLFVERYLESPRHLEVQILADHFGHIVHLGERECSLQRRHQKVIEEAPSPLLTERSRRALTTAALRVGEVAHYRGVGTVEFIVSAHQPEEFFFMEMNTRLQVEHPVTEMVTGIDLVEQQVRVAAGEALAFTQDDVRLDGHAVEARIYAEDPARDFLPTGGDLLYLREPRGAGVRVDSSLVRGVRVGTTYDPMLAKVIAHGVDRAQALARLDLALSDVVTLGVVTNTAFLRELIAREPVQRGELDTDLIARVLREEGRGHADPTETLECAAAFAVAHRLDAQRRASAASRFDVADGWRVGASAWTHHSLVSAEQASLQVAVAGTWRDARVRVGDDEPPVDVHCLDWRSAGPDVVELELRVRAQTLRVLVGRAGPLTWFARRGWTTWWRSSAPSRRGNDRVDHDGDVRSPMPGVVIQVAVHAGDVVSRGDPLLVVEAMKMEYPLRSPLSGRVVDLAVVAGDQVVLDQLVARVSAVEEPSSPRGEGE